MSDTDTDTNTPFCRGVNATYGVIQCKTLYFNNVKTKLFFQPN